MKVVVGDMLGGGCGGLRGDSEPTHVGVQPVGERIGGHTLTAWLSGASATPSGVRPCWRKSAPHSEGTGPAG